MGRDYRPGPRSNAPTGARLIFTLTSDHPAAHNAQDTALIDAIDQCLP